jgi:hypothetical protein
MGTEPEPDELVEADDDLWSRIINNMIRRSQQQPGSENDPTQLDSRNPTPGATLEGPGAAAPVSSEEAAEYLAGLEKEFPEDEEPADPDKDQGCWHYDHTRFCTQCDPASYKPCDDEDEEEDTVPIDSPPRLRTWLARRRSRIAVGLLVTLGLLDLVFTVFCVLRGHWILALLG